MLPWISVFDTAAFPHDSAEVAALQHSFLETFQSLVVRLPGVGVQRRIQHGFAYMTKFAQIRHDGWAMSEGSAVLIVLQVFNAGFRSNEGPEAPTVVSIVTTIDHTAQPESNQVDRGAGR
jgi:hypothetical protein